MRVSLDPPCLLLLLLMGCLPGGEAYRLSLDPAALAKRDAYVAGPVRSAPRLNVVVVLADDLGLNDTSLSATGLV